MDAIKSRVLFAIEDTETNVGRAFDFTIQFCIVISLICFSIETLPERSNRTVLLLSYIETCLIAIFTIEYLLRVWVSDKSIRFIFSFYGLVDLIAILPYYVGLGADLQSLRAFRFLRLFKVFKLTRYTNALERYRESFRYVRDDLVIFSVFSFILLYLAGVGIYHFEHEAQPEVFRSIFDALWWSVVTLTTTGYGDVYPVTAGGRVFASIILILGLGVVAVPTGLIASALTKAREK
ncbi:Cyclic nucleotide-gated potassium channel [BD1-7 clade bacterium]|uniref:Cyclic nucleotide-gated potassium channel n=1 Tax=BD1-7 clade bacterium TaxID=2029982 RepID=A0A5S9NX00_9GAMM|nr:Cyclic nucleotide-gated potassium channel [BD1-7 clade bacterium]CAA0095896.1 Cyclic nucleotide-gated potassium channel [BD1-7 clade bacterium]